MKEKESRFHVQVGELRGSMLLSVHVHDLKTGLHHARWESLASSDDWDVMIAACKAVEHLIKEIKNDEV